MSFTFDLTSFERRARELRASADQIPFALGRALNDAAEVTRKALVQDTWPSHIQSRNKSFMNASLTTKGERATKTLHRVTIYDKLKRAPLELLAKGGKRQARANFAIPSSDVKARRGARGVPKNLRPRALPNTFRRGDVIYQRTGPKGRKLKLMYVLKPSAAIPKLVPFHADFETLMRREVARAFPIRIAQAMKTRR